MKNFWSPKWASSTQPRKQRKYRYNAPLHIRRKFISVHLSKELREKFGKRSVPLRKGDEVLIMRGAFKGFRGNVERIDLKKSRIYIEGVKRKKVDGSEVLVPIHPSNTMITKLSLDDKRRQEIFERKESKEDAKKSDVKKTSKKKGDGS